ncbi:MAG TPA: ribonuclease catalytic domain-containing protein [Spirochaetota bacterium]|mgnify:FL=1|nr:ribonuclease catalytic domain-containing protein [Spirochaetota bacterium]
MATHDGYLADFLDDDGLKTVLVVQDAGQKLQVIEQFGKQRTIKSAQVLCRYPGGAMRSELGTVIPALHAKTEGLAASMDSELLWSQIETHEKDLPVNDIASLWFGQAGSEEISATFRVLADDNLRFKRNGLTFQARTPAQVESLLLTRQREDEKRQREEAIHLWLDELDRGHLPDETEPEGPEDVPQKEAVAEETRCPPEVAAGFSRALLEFLVDRKQSDVGKIFSDRHPENPYEAAFEVLDRLNLLPPGSNPVSLIAGINPEFSKTTIDEAARLTAQDPSAEGKRLDLTGLAAFSIDDETTREIDDAFTVEYLDGRIRIGVHIADVTALIEQQTPLDREAQSRTLTIYLPEETYTMFPERIGCDLASLNEGEPRRALSLLADFDPESGALLSHEFALTIIRNTWRMTYDETDRVLAGADHGMDKAIRDAHRIALELRRTRLENKAFQISRPELRVHVKDDRIILKVNRGSSKAQVLVQELMVLYNSLAGQLAANQSLPVIYRVQSPPEGRDFPTGREIAYEPHTAGALFKRIRPARLSLEPGAHSGLGVPFYIQASSPIRRYADLVMQRQLTAAALGRRPAYEQGELYRILAAAEGTSREISAIERRSIRFWALEFLAREDRAREYTAIAVQPVGGRTLIELDDYPLRALLEAGGTRPKPGECVPVRIATVDAKRDILTFVRA